MKKIKIINIIIISVFSIAILTVLLSLIMFIIKIPKEQQTEPKIKYTITYEQDYEPGSSTTYYLYDDGSIKYFNTNYCSALDCDSNSSKIKSLKFDKKNEKLTYNFLKSLIKKGNEVYIYKSQIKEEKLENILYYISEEMEELIALELSDYEYKLEIIKEQNYHMVYLDDNKIYVANLKYHNFLFKKINTHSLNFKNNKIVINYIKEQFNSSENFKYIYYDNISYKEKIILDSIIKNDEKLLEDIDNVKDLLFILNYNGVNCLTPTLNIYNDNTYEYNYTYSFSGNKTTPKTGSYDYDINKLLKNSDYESLKQKPEGFFIIKNKKDIYYLETSDKELNEFLESANLSIKSFSSCLTQESESDTN